MGLAELFLIAVGLSMDAFAVAMGKGLVMRRLDKKQALVIAVFFGGFQALMPMLGYFLGSRFAAFITGFDHWLAFILLAFIGGKMIFDAFKKDDATAPATSLLDLGQLLVLAVATSIDALAVGITLALLQASVVTSACLIGLTTFVLSYLGVVLGHACGLRFKSKAEFFGGAVLLLIGLKILLEHLGLLAALGIYR